jgi:hypothetical protein
VDRGLRKKEKYRLFKRRSEKRGPGTMKTAVSGDL